ncbi:hypothetical protein [Microbacterium sp. Se5.02b]|uniref:hypothetical protein n=1 Tax=Microbacterium sp. Se5.02b TaxID=2864103 RepID=UPI00215D6A47|nr:hypothetical protein [Microbacterium sp. Se5.02b]
MLRRDDEADRPTVARHATLPTPSALSTVLKFLGIAVGVVVVSAVAVAAFLVIDVFNRVGDGAVALEGAPRSTRRRSGPTPQIKRSTSSSSARTNAGRKQRRCSPSGARKPTV